MTASLHMDTGRDTLRFERRLRHDVDRVWRAVTDPDELREWFPSAVRYEPRVGAPMEFDFGGEFGLGALPGEVLRWDPPRVFAFDWLGDVLTFELEAVADGGTELVFTHAFAHEPGKPARDAAGWEACFDAFEALLSGAERPGDRWRVHTETYVDKFGALTLDAGGTRRALALTGPYQEVDGCPAVLVSLDDASGVLIVSRPGAELRDGVAVELRQGTPEEPGELLAEGTLGDPLAAGAR